MTNALFEERRLHLIVGNAMRIDAAAMKLNKETAGKAGKEVLVYFYFW